MHDKGTVTVYQPQLESLEGDRLRSRAAVSVALADADPVFGVIWTSARVATDRDERTMQILDVDVNEVAFPEATDAQKLRFEGFVEPQIESWNMVLSLDRVLAMLDLVEQRDTAAAALQPKLRSLLIAQLISSIDQRQGNLK